MPFRKADRPSSRIILRTRRIKRKEQGKNSTLIVNSWELGLGWCPEAVAVKDASCRLEWHIIPIVHVREAAEIDRKLTEVYRNHFVQRHMDIRTLTARKTNGSTATRDMDLYRLCSRNEN